MSDCSHGPVCTMPGSSIPAPLNAVCDTHPDRPASKRVQGETDSFGCEYHHLCVDCVASLQAHAAAYRQGRCDWCGTFAEDLRNRRDYDEGMTGRIYRVCGSCVKKERAAIDNDQDEW